MHYYKFIIQDKTLKSETYLIYAMDITIISSVDDKILKTMNIYHKIYEMIQ
jgi:hypothetical protein